ncbi:uncharacterized protein LOC124929664 [Impatiens glandulifera]|uniref:uncharacterized protein LOC124929664 n=1 Tax=Impatiens glandulifera TaxID=253017 RepID=UPI001FB0F35F|nr:uncharacterized protein LOC124929664 [Impatiens glandulifera]
MEIEKGSERTTQLSLKRKPLLDTTNLIPATIFPKLSSTLSEKPQILSPICEEFPQSSSKLTSESSNVPTSKAHCNSSASNTSIRPCKFRTSSRTIIPMLTGKGNEAIYDSLVEYSTKGSTVEKTNNKAGRGIGVDDANVATYLFSPSPVSRTWNRKKGRKDKGKTEIASDVCLTLEKANDRKSKNAEIPALKTPDAPLPENLNTKRKAISMSRSNKFRDNLNTFEGTSPVKSKCKKLKEETDIFIEQQRSYFKEVDEFELTVEEASDGDSD